MASSGQQLLDEWADLGKPVDGQQGCLAALAALKRRNPHLRTLVSIGGAGASAEFPALAASERSRRVFASQIREFCERHGLDGVDGMSAYLLLSVALLHGSD